ncbi:MAG: right-handed parallel beta-helix repeat-containing protein, partial [Planctomycetota bacterium]|nr:right-handed parallel beta-helix repeat-containing protein [Planctomycetota bacterium]
MRKQALVITFPICICILIAGAWLADAGPPDLNPPPGTVGVSGRFGTRTAILKLPFTITECGSYFLTGCLTGEANRDGITIEADDVTLDLNGFSLIGVGGSFDGVAVPATRTNLVIRNGTVRNWGNDGVDTIRAQNSQLQDLRASGNGVNGLRIGAGGLVTHCTVTENGAFGIFADSGSTVQDCSARNNLGGISVGTGCTVQ